MQTQEIIQANCNVIRITSLRKWDVFKLVDTTYSSAEIKYWVIVDIMNSWDKSFIEVVQYDKRYWNITAEIKIHEWTKDISIFPAKIDEIKEYFWYAITNLKESIEKEEESLQKKRDWLKKAIEFTEWVTSKKLTEVEYTEVNQKQYVLENKEKAE